MTPMKIHFKKTVFLLLLLFILSLCSSVALAESTTIMMYMCGTDLQSSAVEDLYEMCSVNLPSDVTISVHAGGATQWDDSRLTPNQNNRFTIQNGEFQNMRTIGSDSMGDYQTLQSFITDSVNEYPADRYMLVLWDHGGGATAGVCYDETADFEYLTMGEIYNALYYANDETGVHFDLIGFDACLMGGVETAMHLSYYADFMIASQELEPGWGWAYDEWLPYLVNNPDAYIDEIGKVIVDSFIDVCLAYDPYDYLTLSLIDLNEVRHLVSDLNDFGYYLSEALENGELSTFSRARKRMYGFGAFCDASSDMVDLEQFVDAFSSLAPTAAQNLKNKIERSVVYSDTSGQFDYACGLSIFMPQDTKSKFESYFGSYDQLDLIPNYKQFVEAYVSMLNGGGYQFDLSAPEVVDSSEMSDVVFTFGSSSTMPSSSYVASETSSSSTEQDDTENTGTTATSPGGFFGNVTEEEVADTEESETGTINASSEGFFATILQDYYENNTPATSASDTEGYTSVGDTSTSIGLENIDPNSAYAYSLTLSDEDMTYLSYVEGSLWMDISDEEWQAYIDLGYLQNAYIDWDNNTVYSMFDGTWPCLEGQLIPMYDQNVSEKARRSLLSVTVNDVSCYLVIVFDDQSPEGRIVGYSEGYDENGLPVRGTTPLEVGDIVCPEYVLYYYADPEDEEMSMDFFLGDPIEVDEDGLSFQYESLAEDGDILYLFSFFLNDIFGDYQESEIIEFYL